MRIFLFILWISFALLTGCATVSSGNEQLGSTPGVNVYKKIIDGKTTKDDIRSMFGGPDSISFTDGGLLIWMYDFQSLSQKIPFTPQFKGTKTILAILFNRDGSVKEFAYEQSEISRNVSLF